MSGRGGMIGGGRTFGTRGVFGRGRWGALPGALAVVGALALAGCGDNEGPAEPNGEFPATSAYGAEVPIAWFDLALALTRETAGFTPPVASRAFGYVGLTLYEAVVGGMPGYASLQGGVNGNLAVPAAENEDEYHWPAVANAALARIARLLYPTASATNLARIDSLEEALSAGFGSAADAEALARSASRGRTVADAVFAYSVGDGGHAGYARNFPSDYVPPVGAWSWVPTPRPGGAPPRPALQPYWGANRPFALPAGGDPNLECAPGPHTAYSEDTTSAFYAEAMEVYQTAQSLTPEQTEIALFWADNPGETPTPPGHSIAILSQVLALGDADLAIAAEAYAKVGMAVADAFIACWHTKYEYDLLRPVTYIERLIDPSWMPLLETPPFPEYTSGHSVQSMAAARLMTDLFGDGYAFTDRTHEARGLAARSFASFEEAAEEAAISRLYGGIHYRPAIERGLAQGECVAEAVSGLPFRAAGRR